MGTAPVLAVGLLPTSVSLPAAGDVRRAVHIAEVQPGVDRVRRPDPHFRGPLRWEGDLIGPPKLLSLLWSM